MPKPAVVATLLATCLQLFLVAAAPAAASAPPAELTEADLELFLDQFFERELEPQRVVGAGVVVVREGRVLAARGYGYADLAEERPVIADRTLFPAQSVSKLFAATAVMQLHEQGLVDLDADVRGYLGDVPLISEFAEPVTLAHLLSHTAGFDDSYLGLLPRDAEDTLSVPEFLDEYARTVIFRPGTVHAYSNYGSLLARHVVEKVTGVQYEDYLLDRILRPLGMEQSCALPPPPEWVDRFATGYLPAGDGVESTRDAFPDGLVRFRTRTGTVASTVVDMAHFMIAHLERGSFRGVPMLEPETVRLMHRQQFAQHPRVPGATYGFFESTAGGERGIFHFGGGFGYSTLLYLLPEPRIGFYIAHSNSSSRIAELLLTAFVGRYFGSPKPSVAPAAAPADAARFAGYYVQARRPETTFEKLPLGLVQVRLRAADERTLANSQVLPREWTQTGPLTFERRTGGGIVAFAEGAEGDPVRASVWDEEMPQLLVLERVPWFDSTPALLARLAWFVVVLLAIVMVAPIVARLRRRDRADDAPGPSYVGWATWAAALLNLTFLMGVVWIFAARQFFYGVSPLMVAIFWLPLVALALTALALAGAARGWAATANRRWTRLALIISLGTLALFPLFLMRWNLLGFHF